MIAPLSCYSSNYNGSMRVREFWWMDGWMTTLNRRCGNVSRPTAYSYSTLKCLPGGKKNKGVTKYLPHFPANILLVNNRWQSFSMLIYNKINSYKMIVNLCCETCNSEWTVRSCWNKLSYFFFVFFQRKNESSWWNSKQLERSKNHSRCTS